MVRLMKYILLFMSAGYMVFILIGCNHDNENITDAVNGIDQKALLKLYMTNILIGSHSIGQSYGGGIIFYIDGTGQHGLIAAPGDQSSGVQWYNGSYTTISATGTAVGTGQTNTNAIVTNQGPGVYAAQICNELVLGGYSDWFLPSNDELNLMFLNLKGAGVGDFTTLPFYWTSSEADSPNSATDADGLFFDILNGGYSSGFVANFDKSTLGRVRAIRAF